ncbi:hypothetical protein IPH19_03005 [Candidatus Uhrbacteria bacterium]|jgi:hypothetical protein|nr:MAG: hypothetical protein IPH19_03005 [Candidatus Uhrbacteria bacterium]
MTALFVSFTALLRALRDGIVTESDLATGLFYFGCRRQHAFDPSGKYNEVKWFYKNDAEGQAVHGKIVDALTKAEADGRALWRDADDGEQSFERLNTMLVAHDLKPLGLQLESFSDGGQYSYPGVAERVKEANLPLRVIL